MCVTGKTLEGVEDTRVTSPASTRDLILQISKMCIKRYTDQALRDCPHQAGTLR